MTTELRDPNDVLMGGGCASATFNSLGASVSGVICERPETKQQQDMVSGEPMKWANGDPKEQIVVTLQTDERNPDDEDDDGRRRVYIKAQSHMKHAVRDAVKKAGAKGLEIGGRLSVAWTSSEKSQQKGFNDRKIYSAEYLPPSSVALNDPRDNSTDGFDAPSLTFATFADALAWAQKETSGKMTKEELSKTLKAAGFNAWNPPTCSPFVIEAVINFIPF